MELTGQITQHDGDLIACEVNVGIDILLSHNATLAWNDAAIDFVQHIKSTAKDKDQLIELLKKYGVEDAHWNWSSKSLTYNSSEYTWFYLLANEKIQAIAITYHPEVSRMNNTKQIFYIEYLAVAPWNRRGYLPQRLHKGVGTTLLEIITTYFTDSLGYEAAFSLHSLPQSFPYYIELGMTDFGPDEKKSNMHYFEIDSTSITLGE